MQRIMIIGCGGAGKSTFARELGKILERPVTHLDGLYWKPNWQETPRPEWTDIQKELVQNETWILDGNYGATMEIRLEAADTIFLFDLPTHVCLWSAISRVLKYRKSFRPDLAPGCPEHWDFDFLRYIWNYRRAKRPGILERLTAFEEGRRIFTFHSRKEAWNFLEKLKINGTAISPPTHGENSSDRTR